MLVRRKDYGPMITKQYGRLSRILRHSNAIDQLLDKYDRVLSFVFFPRTYLYFSSDASN
jgi:hypothetical protein